MRGYCCFSVKWPVIEILPLMIGGGTAVVMVSAWSSTPPVLPASTTNRADPFTFGVPVISPVAGFSVGALNGAAYCYNKTGELRGLWAGMKAEHILSIRPGYHNIPLELYQQYGGSLANTSGVTVNAGAGFAIAQNGSGNSNTISALTMAAGRSSSVRVG